MPRRPRQHSFSGYLHLTAKGNGRQILFEEHADYRYYISILERFSREMDVTIIAYCLMNNHVHILIHDREGHISLFMKKLNVSYAGYFNKKYDGSGHVFQDRFHSEAIESEEYLLSVYRYILQNPQRAGICHASMYAWSSYPSRDDEASFIDTSVIRELLGNNSSILDFINEEIEILKKQAPRVSDDAALELVRSLIPGGGPGIRLLSREERNTLLRKLRAAGLTIKQIERLTGISRGIIQRV